MELKRIMKLQALFDKERSGVFDWSGRGKEDSLEALEFLLICMIGELGELSNIVKKVIRGDFPLADKKEQLEEEVADTFIYLLKICNKMNIDLEENFLKKLERNKTRFKHYGSSPICHKLPINRGGKS